jgi:hypothetical protein
VGDFFFVIKTFFATLLLLAFMQVKIGDTTIESRAYQILAQSKLTTFLNEVAHRGVRLGKQIHQELESQLSKTNTEK